MKRLFISILVACSMLWPNSGSAGSDTLCLPIQLANDPAVGGAILQENPELVRFAMPLVPTLPRCYPDPKGPTSIKMSYGVFAEHGATIFHCNRSLKIMQVILDTGDLVNVSVDETSGFYQDRLHALFQSCMIALLNP